MMKKSLVLTLVLSALLLVTVMAVSVSADASLTIGEVSFVKDTTNNLVTFTVPYTAVDVDQITVIAVKGPDSAAPAATEANIVYFNQQSSASSSFTFSVALSAFDSTNPYCWIKVGGTAIATASSDGGQEIWAEAAPVLVYGDLNGDGFITVTDVTLITKLFGVLATDGTLDPNDFPNGKEAAIAIADVNGVDGLTVSDVTLVTKYFGTIATQGEGALDPADFPNGKFPAYAK